MEIDEILKQIMNETDVGNIHHLAMKAYDALQVTEQPDKRRAENCTVAQDSGGMHTETQKAPATEQPFPQPTDNDVQAHDERFKQILAKAPATIQPVERTLHHITANGCSICGTDAPHCNFWKSYRKPEPEAQQPVGSAEQQATEIIERIWSVWYGDFRGDMPSDRFAITLAVAKQKIITAIEKCDLEMERVKACEHIAEGDMDGNDWRVLRNICPSTMAVAELRDKYEALIKREAGDSPVYRALAKLVDLKWYKDAHGKDGYYEFEQKQAWEMAREALAEEQGRRQ